MPGTCGCTILGPECREGRQIFKSAKQTHDVATGRVPLPAGGGYERGGERQRIWGEYQAWYDVYLAHIGLITWEEWQARYSGVYVS